MPFTKALGKAYKAGKKGLKKRYGLNKRSRGLNYGQMASDVLMLKKMVNAEKKAYANTQATQNLGQVNANSTGALCYDITPIIPAGTSSDQRTGVSVKLASALYQFQFSQLSALTIKQKFIIEFWINKGTYLTTATAQDYIHSVSTFSTVIDSNSPRNQDRFSEFQLVRRITRSLSPEQLSGDATVSTFDVPIKFNRGQGHHLRLANTISGSNALDILNGQMFMTVRADVGNANAITASTKSVPLTAVNTGSVMRFAYKVWYYDN